MITILAILALLSAGMCGGAFVAWNSLMCDSHREQQTPSPDQQYVASVAWTDCGATDGFSARVEIEDRTRHRRIRFWMRSEETVFAAYRTVDPRQVELDWQANRALVITYPDTGDDGIRRRHDTWKDIVITYRPISKDG